MSTYQSLPPIDRDAALVAIESGDDRVVENAMLRVALHDPDGEWATEQAVRLADSTKIELRAVAASAFGHIARIHHTIDQSRVIPILEGMLSDPAIEGRADDALDDIRMFIS